MTKAEFEAALRQRLAGLPAAEMEKSIEYYREMIEDRMEEGLTEEEAVAALGPLEAIEADILRETPLPKLLKEKVRPRRGLRAWEVILLILGAPMWLPILLSLLVILLAVYLVMWGVMLALFAAAAALLLTILAGLAALVPLALAGHLPAALFAVGCGLVGGGAGILLVVGCVYLTKGFIRLTKKAVLGIKRSLAGKERKA